MAMVTFDQVDIVFGSQPDKALALLDQGQSRADILAQTGQVLGAANASIAIEAGEICVLMGLSGSGKSTLLRAINGLTPITRGRLLIDHHGKRVDVATCKAHLLRELRTRRIAMVFQQFALFPWRTVRENVGLGLELQGMSKSQRNRLVDEKLQLVGLEQWADKYTHELSGGMQQRVGLARALATDADILLMDEPFSALDPLIRDKLQDELLVLQQTLKKTIIFVSHDLDEAMKIGSHIAMMEGGHIVQYGTPESIVLNPANAYVSEFITHMNPVNVLRGASLMRPRATLPRQGAAYVFGEMGQYQLILNEQGGVAAVWQQGQIASHIEYAALSTQTAEIKQAFVCVPPDTLMRDIIECRQRSGLPVLLVEHGRFLGVVGDTEIYRALVRKTIIP